MTGMSGGNPVPQPKLGVYESALALIASLGGDEDVKARLKKLVEATAAHDAAEESARLMLESAKSTEATARESHERAEVAQKALAREMADANAELAAQRDKNANERHALAEWTTRNETLDTELNRREARLRAAFEAYNKGI